MIGVIDICFAFFSNDSDHSPVSIVINPEIKQEKKKPRLLEI